MPLVRYFLFTGGILLGLLFFAAWYLPQPPAEATAADVDRTVIRIHTGQRWPAAVPIDTTVTIPRTPPPIVARATPGFAPAAPLREAYASASPTPPKASDKRPHRAKPVPRLSARETHRRLAYQSNWFPATW